MNNKKLILAIDDNPQQLENYKLLIGEKYDLRVAESVASASKFIIKHKIDIILLDIEMPGVNGFEFLANIKKILLDFSAHIIIVSGNKDEAFLEKARNSDTFDVLTKPVKQDDLIKVIERALAEAVN